MTHARIEPLRTERIALALIDEPDLPTRETMDADELAKLADSLVARGQIVPIAVEQRGHRYTIIAGHRRFVASRMRHLVDIRAEIYPEGVDYALVIQSGENALREKVNAGEEGEWLDRLYRERCAENFELLVEITGLPEDRAGRNLLIARGDPKILAAVKADELNASVALELNKIRRADHRDYYTQAARTHGATVKTVKLWRQQSELMAAQDATPPPTDAATSTPAEPAPAIVHMCACCGSTKDVADMEYVQVHRYCNKAHLERLREKLSAAGVA